MTFNLTSAAFSDNAWIPVEYTAEGEDRSPPLSWSGAPSDSGCFALTMVDPDAPGGTFHHWTLINIPASATDLPESFPGDMHLADMAELENGFGHMGYGGPLPPHGHGPHRYVFTLRALSVPLIEPVPSEPVTSLIARLDAVTMAKATLIGRYER